MKQITFSYFSIPTEQNHFFPSFLQKFLNDPFTSTLGGFSKVTNFFKDVLLQPESMSTRPREEMAEVLNEDIAGMEINHQDEPGFELITKVIITCHKSHLPFYLHMDGKQYAFYSLSMDFTRTKVIAFSVV